MLSSDGCTDCTHFSNLSLNNGNISIYLGCIVLTKQYRLSHVLVRAVKVTSKSNEVRVINA